MDYTNNELNNSTQDLEEIELNFDEDDSSSEPKQKDNSSLALESLISQNEDLSARLSVNIRRIMILEKQLQSENTQKKTNQEKIYNLEDQIFLLKEKCKASSGAYIRLQTFVNEIEEDKQKAEAYIEKYKERVATLVKRFSLRHHYFLTFRKNVKSDLATKDHAIENLEKQIPELKNSLETQGKNSQQECEALTNQLKDSHEQKAQELKKIHAQSQDQMNQQKEEMERLSGQSSKLKLELHQFMQENIKISNTLISKEKQISQLSTCQISEQNSLVSKVADYEKNLQNLTTEKQRQEEKALDLEAKLHTVNEEHIRNSKELENLRELWLETQNKLEQKETQSTSLQKLNHQLSLSLNEKKEHIKRLQDKVESSHFKKDSKLKEIQRTALDVDNSMKQISTRQELIERLEKVATETQRVGLFKKSSKNSEL